MIDLNLLRNDFEKTKELVLRKEPTFAVDNLAALDQQCRSLRMEVETLRKEKNDLAALGAKGASAENRERAMILGTTLKELEKNLTAVEQDLNNLWLSCPNIIQEDLPIGGKEANKVVSMVGVKPEFSFTPKHHLDLNEKANWFNLDVATRIAGSQFVLYNEMGTKIIYALTQMMLRNNAKHGYKPVLPPVLAREKSLYNSGNLPKFAGDFYTVNDEGLCLIPTAEVSLTNIYADTILPADQLPKRMCAWTSCFRREAGGYGSTERGLIRIHQFEKVEIYAITEPEHSSQELDRMVACAEEILKMLGLHYRVSLLATQDCSFSSARTYDIEVWLPGQNSFYEVSSCSNCTDFQARRAGIRYRKTPDAKPTLAHTLNASSLALSRLMVALMENYQQPDGTIILPPALQQVMDQLW